ncbi:N-acetylmuramoyl-L-alanine amidase [Xylanibacillus composti]|uniref:N-acetylmuramoyl-L-alanine amidase n=1 Tax=Xylanibacillus composti TaxID=1572762 RepID=A0A8J4H1W3_9BACL|nr:N-acetylmuramoyl-L-alanine amidase [Xylanibacillus composti]MDT9726694.1 N-acetylmuramoyl-L-alanine amidase [Xylanibacillus composti]GIQ69374.1 hypothetical protein XYCOK13_21980 [Xylanibacillus composti]
MQPIGVVMHHAACPSINGKGYDFFIRKDGTVIAAEEPQDTDYVHICLEGDFSRRLGGMSEGQLEEQCFVVQKLLIRLFGKYGLSTLMFHGHNTDCPGPYFPWSKLVISPANRYH